MHLRVGKFDAISTLSPSARALAFRGRGPPFLIPFQVALSPCSSSSCSLLLLFLLSAHHHRHGGAETPTGSPAEQWDALPAASKWQIILFVGIMELFAESVPPHYMKGGQPGKFPSFAEAYKEGRGFPHPVPFDLYDPFGFSKNRSPEAKARGLLVEINNGRAAMLGIFGFLSESKVSGSVPVLTGLGIPHYDGEYMAPFAANFHLGA